MSARDRDGPFENVWLWLWPCLYLCVCVCVVWSSRQPLVCEHPRGKHVYPNLLTSLHPHAWTHIQATKKRTSFLTLDVLCTPFSISKSSLPPCIGRHFCLVADWARDPQASRCSLRRKKKVRSTDTDKTQTQAQTLFRFLFLFRSTIRRRLLSDKFFIY